MDMLKWIGTFSAAVLALTAVIGLVAGTAEYVSAQVHEVKNVKADVTILTNNVTALKAGQDTLTAIVTALESKVTALESNVVVLKNNVDALKAGQDEILEWVRIQVRQARESEKDKKG